LPKPQRDHFSFLCNHIETMFRSGQPSYPVERTLLVTGMLDALHDSRAAGGKRIETPHLSQLKYTPAKELLNWARSLLSRDLIARKLLHLPASRQGSADGST
jgi:hypothetical protein